MVHSVCTIPSEKKKKLIFVAMLECGKMSGNCVGKNCARVKREPRELGSGMRPEVWLWSWWRQFGRHAAMVNDVVQSVCVPSAI